MAESEESSYWRWLAAAVLAPWLVWATVFIGKTVVRVGDRRVACLQDDAMITMAYARSWVEGRGLTWGHDTHRVEGFTHPLWLALMVIVNASGMPVATRSLLVQAASVLCLAGTFLAVVRLVRRHFAYGPSALVLPAAIAALFYFPLNFWALTGMETGLQALLLVLGADAALDLRRGRGRSTWVLAIVLAAMLLLRLDMLAVVACLLVFAFVRPDPVSRRQDVGKLLRTGLLAALPVAVYQIFRWQYFGAWLPNTFYLKLYAVPLAPRLWRGTLALADFAAPISLALLSCVLGVLALGRRRSEILLISSLFACCLAYSVWVGGDAWERMDVGAANDIGANRFLAPVMPLVFVGASGLLNLALARRRQTLDTRRGPWRRAGAELGVAVLLVAAFQGLLWPSDAGVRLRHLRLAGEIPLIEGNQRTLERLRAAEKVLPADSTLAVVWAGIPAFFSDLRLVDVLGYTDSFIARSTPRRGLEVGDARALRPGHVKWDYDYLVREYAPDAFLQIWPPGDAEVLAMLRTKGYRQVGALLRKDAPN